MYSRQSDCAEITPNIACTSTGLLMRMYEERIVFLLGWFGKSYEKAKQANRANRAKPKKPKKPRSHLPWEGTADR